MLSPIKSYCYFVYDRMRPDISKLPSKANWQVDQRIPTPLCTLLREHLLLSIKASIKEKLDAHVS